MSMMSRRNFMHSVAAVAAVSAAGRALPAVAEPLRRCGCCLRGLGPTALGQRTNGIISGVPDHFLISTTSGDPAMDKFLGRALVRLATTFRVRPGFAFFNDGTSPNAFATSSSLLSNTSGTVLVGSQLFSDFMNQNGDHGMTVIAICAHEFGHIHQMDGGYQDELQKLDRTVKPIELHADFLAGYFLALRKKEHPNLDLQAVGRTFYRLGDTDFAAPQHHGTAEERIAAITAGFDLGKKTDGDIDTVAKAGMDFVRQAG